MTLHFLQSEIGADPVVVEEIIPAPVARVYRAWTDPDDLVHWFGLNAGAMVSAEIDLRVGGQWRFVMGETPGRRSVLRGEYLAIEPAARLEFTWCHVLEFPDGRHDPSGISNVKVAFEPHGAATRLRLHHQGIASQDSRRGVGNGWEASFAHLRARLGG